MIKDANDFVRDPRHSTGRRIEEGKAKSSRNAIRTGLYAARDFVRPEEEEEYSQTLIKLMDELTPENSVEQTFATEIVGATWRLRRCRLVEEAFGLIEDLNVDPMIDERTEKQQKSVDRAPCSVPPHPPPLPRRTSQAKERPNHPGTTRRPEPNSQTHPAPRPRPWQYGRLNGSRRE